MLGAELHLEPSRRMEGFINVYSLIALAVFSYEQSSNKSCC